MIAGKKKKKEAKQLISLQARPPAASTREEELFLTVLVLTLDSGVKRMCDLVGGRAEIQKTSTREGKGRD